MPDSTLTTSIVIGAALGSTFGRTFQTAEQRSRKLGEALKTAQVGAQVAGRVVLLRKELASLQRRQKRVGDSTGQLGRQIAEVRQAYGRAREAARQYGIRVGDAARQQRRFSEEARQAEQALGRLQRRQERRAQRQQLHSQALPLLGAGYAVGRVFSGALDVEQAQVRLRTVLDSEDVGKSLEESRRHAVEFARRSLADETEILEIEYALNSAGLGEQLSRAGSEVVSRLATVTRGAPELVGEVVATTMRNLGDGLEGSAQERFGRVADLLAKAQFQFQIRDFGQLGESMKMAAPELSKYNVALEQGVTLIGALNSAGLQGTMAGTALGASFRRLSKASREFGFELARDEKGQLDFIQTLQNLRAALGGSFDGLDQDELDKLDRAFESEGSRAVILLGKQLDQLAAAQDDVAEGSKGIVDKSYQFFLESAPGQMKMLADNVRSIGTAFATTLLPALNWVLALLAGAAGWIGGLAERFPALGVAIGGVAAGLVGVIGTLWLVKYAIAVGGDAWEMGKVALGGLGDAAKWTRARLGPSPRLRGKLDQMDALLERDRCIPAPAGETEASSLLSRICRVHPRACGGNMRRTSQRSAAACSRQISLPVCRAVRAQSNTPHSTGAWTTQTTSRWRVWPSGSISGPGAIFLRFSRKRAKRPHTKMCIMPLERAVTP